MLEVVNLVGGYGDLEVLHGVSLQVTDGEAVALLGSNGAGKTTLLKMVSRLLPIRSGKIIWNGQDLSALPAHRLAEFGIAHVPEGRGILTSLTVLENLELGAFTPRAKRERRKSLEEVFTLFPILKERQKQRAGTLSGGQQQMLSIGRALMLRPKILLLDEPSLGLAPLLVQNIFEKIATISQMGVSILLVEQNLLQALKVARRGYVLETGRIVLAGDSDTLQQNEEVRRAYLGV